MVAREKSESERDRERERERGVLALKLEKIVRLRVVRAMQLASNLWPLYRGWRN